MEGFYAFLGTLLRHGLTVAGTLLVSKGYLDATQASQLVEFVAGGGMILVAAIASYVTKRRAQQAVPK